VCRIWQGSTPSSSSTLTPPPCLNTGSHTAACGPGLASRGRKPLCGSLDGIDPRIRRDTDSRGGVSYLPPSPRRGIRIPPRQPTNPCGGTAEAVATDPPRSPHTAAFAWTEPRARVETVEAKDGETTRKSVGRGGVDFCRCVRISDWDSEGIPCDCEWASRRLGAEEKGRGQRQGYRARGTHARSDAREVVKGEPKRGGERSGRKTRRVERNERNDRNKVMSRD
jgi:hypothetical protein